MNKPLISVIIPTYDSERTIEKCLLSVKKQTYPNIEIIVVDGLNYPIEKKVKCRKIIRKYAAYYEDGPERSIQRNRGIQEARGEYILSIDQDMYLTENVVFDCFNTMQQNDFVALNIPEISIGEGYWTKCVALERYVSTVLEDGLNESCRFFRKISALEIGGYDSKIVGIEDSDFHYKMQTKGRIGKIKSIIFHDEGRTVFFNRVRKKFYYSKAFREYVNRYPDIAVKQFFPFKKAYIKHWKILVKNPLVTAGMIVLRAAEVMSGVLGLFMAGYKYGTK